MLLRWLTLLQILTLGASAANCFTDSDAIMLPQLMNYDGDEGDYYEKYYAVDGTDTFLIYGGE